MQFPDAVTILRAQGEDEYGNPDASFYAPLEIPARGFHYEPGSMLMPAVTDIQEGDRVKVGDQVYRAEPTAIRSPAKRVMWSLKLTEV